MVVSLAGQLCSDAGFLSPSSRSTRLRRLLRPRQTQHNFLWYFTARYQKAKDVGMVTIKESHSFLPTLTVCAHLTGGWFQRGLTLTPSCP